MNNKKKEILKMFIYESFQQSKLKCTLCFFVMICLTVLGVLLPRILQKLIDGGIMGGNLNTLIAAGFAYLVFLLFISILNVVQAASLSSIKTKLMFYYKYKILKKLSKFSGSFYSNMKSGETLNIVLEDTDSMEDFGVDILFDFIRNTFTALFAFFMLIYLEPNLFCAVIIIQAVTVVIQLRFTKVLEAKTKEIRDVSGKVYNIVEQYVAHIMEIIISKSDGYFLKNYVTTESIYYKKGIRLDTLFAANLQIGTFLSGLMTIIIYIIGGYNIIHGKMLFGQLVAFQQYTMMFIGPCMGLLKMNETFHRMLVSLERIYDFLRKTSDVDLCENGRTLPGNIQNIEFKNVCFAYSENEVLKNINCLFQSGRVYAVVGSTGCGKSTLVHLLYRMWDVGGGEIIIDASNIKNYNLESLRNGITVISQNSFILDDTIEKNLIYDNSELSKSSYMDVCKNIGIHEFICGLPQGYQTVVGENGIKLSGGQRQRIAIARMLLQAKSVLVFDEATSALDNITQSSVLENIKKYYKDRIIIIIAHRLSTIRTADEILVLKDGEIHESGNHSQLMSIRGEYYQLVTERNF